MWERLTTKNHIYEYIKTNYKEKQKEKQVK